MHEWVTGQVLRFIEEGHLWSPGELDSLLERLVSEGRKAGNEALAVRLAAGFEPLVERRRGDPLPLRLRADLEAVVYPRLWKLVEGIQGGVADGELDNRINALRRGIARVLDGEF
jgi:hypothetical protein